MITVLFLTSLLASLVTADIGTFVQVTDMHYDPYYEEGTWAECWRGDEVTYPCCHSWEIKEGNRTAGKIGDYNCDSPMILLDDMFKFLQKLDPSMVLWTGDTAGNNVLSQSPWQNLHAIKMVTDKFKKYIPNAMVYPCYGNHDTWPADQVMNPPEWDWLFDNVADYWGQWVKDKNLRRAGFYSQLIDKNLRLISLNTLYYDSNNIFEVNKEADIQWRWFENTLENARISKEKVWIIGHVFPGNGESKNNYSRNYNNVVTKYKDIITGQFYGHSHKDEFRLIRNLSTNEPTSMFYIAPSVTPISIMNPSVRVYYYNRTTYEILDYAQYNADLNNANKIGRLNFTYIYSPKETYKMKDLSAKSWYNLLTRFMIDDNLFQLWYKLYHGLAYNGKCDKTCKYDYICYMSYSTKEEVDNCKKIFSKKSI